MSTGDPFLTPVPCEPWGQGIAFVEGSELVNVVRDKPMAPFPSQNLNHTPAPSGQGAVRLGPGRGDAEYEKYKI